MAKDTKVYNCRVCGLQQDDLPWGEDGNTPTYDICDCCGVEFGYEDSTVKSVVNYRSKWLKGGTKWFRPIAKPANWDLEDQLLQVPIKFRETQHA